MTSPQDYVAVAMPARAKVPDPGAVDKAPITDVYLTQAEAIEFFAMLRCSLLQIVRWIERRYPDAVK
jgi:hypothetical protein